MTENPTMKRALIMQSFAPLFLILLIKYFDIELVHLCKKFFGIILNNPIGALTKSVSHSAFVTLILEFFCLLWIIYSVYSVRKFEKSQRANFVSEGESLIDIEKISDSGVTFFMTYVLPMAMDDLIYGAVANDDVYRTITLYMTGVLDKEQTLMALKIRKLFNQLVFGTEKSLQYLHFEGRKLV